MAADADAGNVPRKEAASSLAAAAALADRSRHRMYEFIRQARRPVSREEAASSIGISRKLAAFHLDKLVEVGLLRAHFTPVASIRKVGRTPKVYEPADVDLRISIPDRRPELLAEILIDAVLRHEAGRPAVDTAADAAREHGTRIGAAERDRLRPGRLGPERGLTLVVSLLARCGFEPEREAAGRVRLGNCPFQPLAGREPELVCRINHAFTTGIVDGLQATGVTALAAARPAGCCIEFATR